MLNFINEIWNIIKEFWASLTALIFWKIIRDTLPSDMSIPTIYKFSKRIFWRLITTILLGFIFLAIKLRVPSEQQKIALIATAAILAAIPFLMELKNQKTIEKNIN